MDEEADTGVGDLLSYFFLYIHNSYRWTVYVLALPF